MALLAAAMSAGAVAGGVFSGWLPRVRRQGLVVVAAIVVWTGNGGFRPVQRVGRRACRTAGCGVRWRSSRSADAVHGAAAAVVGTTIAAAGGGGLVVVGVLIAALAVPAFVRYRVSTAGDQPVDLGNQSESAGYHPKRGGGRRGGDSGTA